MNLSTNSTGETPRAVGHVQGPLSPCIAYLLHLALADVTQASPSFCSINQTDQMLAHLQSFSSVPEHFTLPDSTKSGVPLFYIPPGSTTPVSGFPVQVSHSVPAWGWIGTAWSPEPSFVPF